MRFRGRLTMPGSWASERGLKARELASDWDLTTREIADIVGMTIQGVGLVRRNLMKRMEAAGEVVPPCRCGKPQMHRGECADYTVSDREIALALMRTATPLQQVEALSGVPKMTLWSLRKSYLTAEEREEIDRLRAKGRVARAKSKRPKPRKKVQKVDARVIPRFGAARLNDPLHTQIASTLKRVDPADADDLASEAYLRMLEGYTKDEAMKVSRRQLNELRHKMKSIYDTLGDTELRFVDLMVDHEAEDEDAILDRLDRMRLAA